MKSYAISHNKAMARKRVIDLEDYSMLETYCIGLNEYWKSLKKAGFPDDIALALLLEPLTYPATILPTPNWLPNLPDSIPYDDDED
jgi:hypothetical protein